MNNKYKKSTVIIRTAILALSMVLMVSCNDDVQIEELQTETELNVEELPTSIDNQTNKTQWVYVTPGDKTINLVSVGANKYLAVDWRRFDKDENIITDKSSTSYNDWKIKKQSDGWYTLDNKNVDSDKRVLEIKNNSTSNNANLQLAKYDQGDNQRWLFQVDNYDNTSPRKVRLINKKSRKAVQPYGNKAGNGAEVVQKTASNTNKFQQWYFYEQ